MKPYIKIGNASGFWGDDPNALKRQLEFGDIDYITSDYLAEITMSILRKQQIKNEKNGYVTDFVKQYIEIAQLAKNKNVRIITNAGGINPLECAKKIIAELKNLNISIKIAVIEGDNIIGELNTLYPEKTSFKNMDTQDEFETIRDKVQSANVYLGVAPIVEALKQGAELIIAGRVTDTSITMAPMIYEFNWQLNDWDKLASALVAGHIIECGAQSTGGNFTDWHLVTNWENFGYPIVEVYPDSTFVVTKHKNTGGIVTVNTVKEQLVYEMGSAMYISPDVVADFSTIQLEQQSENRVRVWGVKGYPSTPFYKVSIAYEDGYKATGAIIISGPNAITKAKIFENIFWNRLTTKFEKTHTEYTGYNSCHKNLAEFSNANEIYLRFHVYDHDIQKFDDFAKNIAPLILSGPPGVAVTGGRPSPTNVMAYYPTLIPKNLVNIYLKIFNENGDIVQSNEIKHITGYEENLLINEHKNNKKEQDLIPIQNGIKIKLKDICLARSGDKGDTSNIGIIARNLETYSFLKIYLTEEWMKKTFSQFCKGNVIRAELDNLLALNFLLEESLDGGGTKSLFIDAQGKTFASAFLNTDFYVTTEVYKSIKN